MIGFGNDFAIIGIGNRVRGVDSDSTSILSAFCFCRDRRSVLQCVALLIVEKPFNFSLLLFPESLISFVNSISIEPASPELELAATILEFVTFKLPALIHNEPALPLPVV